MRDEKSKEMSVITWLAGYAEVAAMAGPKAAEAARQMRPTMALFTLVMVLVMECCYRATTSVLYSEA